MNVKKQRAAIRSVLVVDNDPGVLTFMTALLEREEMTVATAEDGLEALSTLETIEPDLIFVDLVMPNISGDKLGRILRSQDRFSDTYLIMISAISPEEDIDFRLFGYDACIAKGPFNEMGPIVLDVIAQLGTTITRTNPGGIYGRETLYKREITRELLATKRHSELIIDNLAESILETNRAGQIIFANTAATHLFEIREEILLSSDFPALFTGRQREQVARQIADAVPGTPPEAVTLRYKGRIITLHVLAVDDEGSVSPIIIAQDVTELQRSREELEQMVTERTQALQDEIEQRSLLEDRLRASLQEKEAMLEEIHHRVKNNLQVVSSLLNLSSRRVDDGALRGLLQDTRRRIHSLALVHDKLYSSGNLGAVDAQQYFQELVEVVVTSMATEDCRVNASVDAHGVTLPIEIAVPCALIVNELITNALKHAFQERSSGTICVIMKNNSDRSYTIEISDDGVGLPDTATTHDTQTLGFRIVNVLVRQLDAQMEIERTNGVRFRIVIPASNEEA